MTQDQKRDSDKALEKKHRKPENKRAEKHMKNALRSSNFAAHLHDDELDECGYEYDEDEF
jgi:hypothetical protein